MLWFIGWLAFAESPEDTAWQRVLDDVVQGVVSIRVTATRDFDTDSAGSAQGTGFVVDAERGLILTNRHLVYPGPVLSEAVFHTNEEVTLEPIYRDPVHDFGLYRFDPSKLKHTELVELPLNPAGAKVGTEIRVVGNNAGEKVSILDSTIARTDRNVPDYGVNAYNDHNTFYIQAASNTSGGSSGSPVVNQEGEVIALNAGGATGAASSFYLPLYRVVRALGMVQDGEAVTRGTIQTTFVDRPFDEAVRLGMTEATEQFVRAEWPEGRTGMLAVDRVVPEGPGFGKLQPGDLLVSVEGEPASNFVDLESVLDGSVGETVELEVERGGRRLKVDLSVGDLFAISPSEYLEVSRGVLHPVSFHQARNHNRPVRGVYLTATGYMWSTADVPPGAVITHVDGAETPTLEAMRAELEKKANGQRMAVRFNVIHDPRQSYEAVVVMDRRWFPMRHCKRDEVGHWPCVEAPAAPAFEPPPPAASIQSEAEDKVAKRLARSFVLVDFDIPHPTAGVKDLNYIGVGTIIDAERGLVLVDRDTVPVTLGDMSVTLAGAVRIPARLAFLHPAHNFAVISFDPSLAGEIPIEAVRWAEDPLEKDDTTWQVGLDSELTTVSKKVGVEEVIPLILGASNTPRFRDSNISGVVTDEAVRSLGGVLADKKGRVQALWASFLDQQEGERFFYGLPSSFIRPITDALSEGEEPEVRILGAELVPLAIGQARDRGISDARVRQFLAADGREVFEVFKLFAGSDAASKLRQTDLVLAIDDAPLTTMSQLDELVRKPRVTVTVLRDGKEKSIEVKTHVVADRGVHRVVSWAGMMLHAPHFELAAQRNLAEEDTKGVYVAWLWFGSPGARYGFRPTTRIVAIDDTPTPTLDALLDAVKTKREGEAVRVTMQKMDGSTLVGSLKLDLHFWPTEVFELGEDGEWQRSTLEVSP